MHVADCLFGSRLLVKFPVILQLTSPEVTNLFPLPQIYINKRLFEQLVRSLMCFVVAVRSGDRVTDVLACAWEFFAVAGDLLMTTFKIGSVFSSWKRKLI